MHRPYQDKNLLSDAELNDRIVVMGPLNTVGYHPYTSILYFLINARDKPRFYAAIRGQSREKAPIFALQRNGRLGTIDSFWKDNMAQALAGAIQFIPLPDKIVVTHMTVRSSWRKLGINSRLVDYLKQRYPGRQVVYENLTKMGQRFVDGYGN